MSPEPSIHAIDLTPQDEFLVLASDGLWDEYDDDEVRFNEGSRWRPASAHHQLLVQAVQEIAALRAKGLSAGEIADVMSKRATKKPHADNNTVILLCFTWGEKSSKGKIERGRLLHQLSGMDLVEEDTTETSHQ